MSKLVVFSLLGGDLNNGFPVVTAQLWHHNQLFKITGSLPPAPELVSLYQRWQLLYEAVHQRLGSNQRIKVLSQDITNISVNDFNEVCQQLQLTINAWLKFESFQNIERQLRTLLNQDDEIRVIFETNISLLHRLPWQLWDFFEDYHKAELALSNHEYASPQVLQKSPTGKVKILAILGNRVGIDIDKDGYLLQSLRDAQTKFLVEPTRKELDEQLWNQDWDILFFAGHTASHADGDYGEIYINQIENLTITQLKNALKTAITRGLKLAIFNSCDGIGLARNLADLNIPQIIVMREPVPDLVAQEFLKNFLVAFAGGKPLYLAMREARERLQGLENDFPCASWLPVICQNPTTAPTTWQELRDNFDNTKFVISAVSTKGKISTPKSKLLTVLFSTIIVAISTLGLRYGRVFENIELQTFDQMLRLRSPEDPDSRVIVVEITEPDIQSRQQTIVGLKSISDSTLAKLLNKLQKYQPRVLGLDIYRDFVDPPNKLKPQLSPELSKDNVVVVCKSSDSQYDPQGVKPPKEVPVERQGFSDAIQDPDGIVRRQILAMQPDPSSPCQTPSSLSFQVAAGYLSYENIKYSLNEDYVQFGHKVFKRLKPERSGAYQEKVNLGGIQILVNYRDANYQRISLEKVLNDKLNPNLFKDRVVLIGVTANTISDMWSTPYSVAQPNYERMPGVFIQAQMISQILSAVLDNRPILWVLPFWGDILWICGWCIVGSLFVWRVHSLSQKVSSMFATVVILYGVCAIALFTQGLWLPFIPSAFAVVTSGIAVLFIQDRRDSMTRQSLAECPKTLKQLLLVEIPRSLNKLKE